MISRGLGVGTFAQVESGTGSILPPSEVPIGVIVHWPGNVASIPSGWGYCNGAIYASLTALGLINPDMRGIFAKTPLGIGPGGTSGGSNTHTHTNGTLATLGAGAHSHGGLSGFAGSHSHTGVTGDSGSHNHTGNTGLNGAHDHGGNTDAEDMHVHGLSSLLAAYGNSHLHGFSAGFTGVAGTVTNTAAGGTGVPAAHFHGLGGINTQVGGGHSHSFLGGQVTGNKISHTHPVSMDSDHMHTISTQADHAHTVALQADHSHTISVDPDHTHTMGGAFASANNIPVYRELHFIIKV